MGQMTSHMKFSFLKSALRGIGYGFLLVNIPTAVGFLLFAEVIGILEECI